MTDLELKAYLEKRAQDYRMHCKSHLDDMDTEPTGSTLYWTARLNAAICLGHVQAYEDVLETMRKATA